MNSFSIQFEFIRERHTRFADRGPLRLLSLSNRTGEHKPVTYLSCRNASQRIDEIEFGLLIGDRIYICAALLYQFGDRLLDLTSPLGQQNDVLGQQLPVFLVET